MQVAIGLEQKEHKGPEKQLIFAHRNRFRFRLSVFDTMWMKLLSQGRGPQVAEPCPLLGESTCLSHARGQQPCHVRQSHHLLGKSSRYQGEPCKSCVVEQVFPIDARLSMQEEHLKRARRHTLDFSTVPQALVTKVHAPHIHGRQPRSASSLLFLLSGSLSAPSRRFRVSLDRLRLHVHIPTLCFRSI